MGKYREVYRCKSCEKIYAKNIPYFCDRCGMKIGRPTPIIIQMLGAAEVTPTEQCEKVLARKNIFGWKVRESEESEVIL